MDPLVLQLGFATDANPLLGVLGSALSAFLTTLVVGAILFTVAPEYTTRTADAVRDEPLASLLYGLTVLVFLVLVIVVLFVTIIGVVVALPLALAAFLVWAVGSAIAFFVIGEALVGREDGWQRPLALGAVLNGLLTLTGVGGLLTFCVGAAGFGAVMRDWLAD